jgi:hypothetical protein
MTAERTAINIVLPISLRDQFVFAAHRASVDVNKLICDVLAQWVGPLTLPDNIVAASGEYRLGSAGDDHAEMERRAREESGRDADDAIVTEYAHRITQAAMPAIDAMCMKLAREHTMKAFEAHLNALKQNIGTWHNGQE